MGRRRSGEGRAVAVAAALAGRRDRADRRAGSVPAPSGRGASAFRHERFEKFKRNRATGRRDLKAGKYALFLLAVLSLAPQPAPAKESMSREKIEAIVAAYIKAHPDEIGALVKDYVLRHPEVLREIFVELSRQKAQSQNDSARKADNLAGERAQKIAANAQDLFNSPHQVTLGDPGGDVTLVEFFDYNCGYCKRALADTVALLGADAHVRLVLKEFPILGPRSVDAAQVAIAARMQDPKGDKYFAFHRQLLGLREPVTQDAALAAARETGFDMERLQRDMTSEEVTATLTENMTLASALHITGTPTYVAGDEVFVGAIGLDALKAQIALLRQRGAKAN
jgi:protein-disulfide isomerase